MSLNILLYGAWKNNLGDDLFVWIICNRYPDVTFHIFTDKKYGMMYRNIKNLKVHFNNNKVKKALNLCARKLRLPDLNYYMLRNKCDAAVFLGGSLYQQETYWKEKAKKRLDIVNNYKRCFVVGNNFGPYTNEEFYDFYKRFFKKMQYVCFRDQYSADLFKDLDNVHFAPDVVLGLPQKKINMLKASKHNGYAVISVIDLDYKSVSRKNMQITTEKYELWIKALILSLERQDMDVVLMGFCCQEGDDKAIYRIIENGKNDFKRTTVHIHKNIDESLKLLKGAELIVATRFHAMILAWVLNVPVLPLVYGSKMLNVINDYKFEGKYYRLVDLNSAIPDINVEEAGTLNSIENVAKNAEKQFKGLDQWLKMDERCEYE